MNHTPGPPEGSAPVRGHLDSPPVHPGHLPPVPAETPAEATRVPLAFTGRADEYFRIWIVNLCLSVLTLGIYSAWAKVRTQRYFYAHTRVAGAPLDYLANPVGILKGRALVVMALAAYTGLTYAYPGLETPLGLAAMFFVPWLVVQSLRFRTHNSSWRNIRLGFDGRYGGALKVFVGLPLLIPFTLGLIYPYFQWQRARFVYANSRFGTTRIVMNTTPGQFFSVFTRAAGLTLVSVLLLTVAFTTLLPSLMGAVTNPGAPDSPDMVVLWLISLLLPVLIVWSCIIPAYAYVQAHTANVIWNGIQAGPHGFSCALRAAPLGWIYLSNLAATVLTLGLAIPWARVRMARYRVENMALLRNGDLDGFVQAETVQVSASGEEFGEMFDLDVGL